MNVLTVNSARTCVVVLVIGKNGKLTGPFISKSEQNTLNPNLVFKDRTIARNS